jgi:hypothetical protein
MKSILIGRADNALLPLAALVTCERLMGADEAAVLQRRGCKDGVTLCCSHMPEERLPS